MTEGISPEKQAGPKIRVLKYDGQLSENRGKRMREILEDTKEYNHAGDAEMDYVMRHPNSPEANAMKDGSAYFFFGATFDRGDLVPCLRWDKSSGQFNKRGWWFHETWENFQCRMVLRA